MIPDPDLSALVTWAMTADSWARDIDMAEERALFERILDAETIDGLSADDLAYLRAKESEAKATNPHNIGGPEDPSGLAGPDWAAEDAEEDAADDEVKSIDDDDWVGIG